MLFTRIKNFELPLSTGLWISYTCISFSQKRLSNTTLDNNRQCHSPLITNQSIIRRRVARNSQWGAVLGSGGKVPSRRRPVGAEPPALEIFAFFCKNNLILGLF